MKVEFNYTYSIGDTVYHITPESDKGVVIDVEYSMQSKKVEYTVSFGRRSDDTVVCTEEELTDEKTFI